MFMFYSRTPLMLILLYVPVSSPLPNLLKLPPEPPREDLRPRPERLRVSRRLPVAATTPPRATLLTRDRFGCNSKASFGKVRG